MLKKEFEKYNNGININNNNTEKLSTKTSKILSNVGFINIT